MREAYPTEFVNALSAAGYLAALIREEYGGAGLPLPAMVNHNSTEMFFDGARVPAENLIVEEGKGFKYILGIPADLRFSILSAAGRPTADSARSRKRPLAGLLDHLVGAHQERLRDCEAQGLGGLAVDE
ncbi:MAG: hypothetical protein AAB654_15610 [Acidobacteriota bacterium]